MANVKKVDCALLPPCAKTLRNKTRRAHFISIVWGNADSAHPGEGLDPLNYGWKDKNGDYAPDWFSGPALPDYLFQERELLDEDPVDQPDLATEFNDADDFNSDLAWSEDSDSESEMSTFSLTIE